jgi:hypothetical protein
VRHVRKLARLAVSARALRAHAPHERACH